MTGQESIPVPDPVPPRKLCEWCGKKATEHITIEPARWRNDRGTRVVAKPERLAAVCAAHYKSLKRTGER